MLRAIDREIDTNTLELDGLLQGSYISSSLLKKVFGRKEPQDTTTTMDLTEKGHATDFSLVFDKHNIIFKRKGITQKSKVVGAYCLVSNNLNPNHPLSCVDLDRNENMSDNITDIIAHQKDLELDFFRVSNPNQFEILMFRTDSSDSNKAIFQGVSHVKFEYLLTVEVEFHD